jgi:cell fate regulator YaaT (PSP1 superfamily)
MKIVEVYLTPWEKLQKFQYNNEEITVGDYVVVQTEVATEIGKIIKLYQEEVPENTHSQGEQLTEDPHPREESQQTKETTQPTETTEPKPQVTPIVRKANKEDLEKLLDLNKQKNIAMEECKRLIVKHDLPIKLIDVYFTIDDSRVTFAFIADGRVDFRGLLKDLNKKFKKNIRLQQLGIRDEIKMTGDIGCCGKELCCRTHLKELASITSDLADLQQVAHRGSDRLSGVCGRLKCCLLYEKATYEELADTLPLIGEKVRTDHGRGQVIAWHVLKQSVDVLLNDQQTIVEVPIVK